MSANPDDPIPFEEVRQLGEQLLEILRDCNPSLDYDEQSIEWLEGYIGRNRGSLSEDKRYGWAIGIGYVIGETMIASFGGKWEYDLPQQVWLVAIGPPVGKANPIAKAYKCLSGPYDSIASMLRITRTVIEKGGWDKIGTRLSQGEADLAQSDE